MAARTLNLTEQGKNFIKEVCRIGGNDLLSGRKNYPMPFSDDGNGNLVDKQWTSNARFQGKLIEDPDILSDALIYWFNEYGSLYELDPNILAAQTYVESGYNIWGFDKNTTASGVNKFTMPVVFGVIVNNFGNVQPKMSETTDIVPIINGLEDNISVTSYQPDSGNIDTKTIARRNRPLLHQNIIDNPQIMIKAQARYMKYFSNNCNKLASTSLFCYNRGTSFIADTYTKAIQNFRDKNGDEAKLKQGLDYVLKIFGVLGDKENKLEPFGRNYKPEPKGLFNNKSYFYFGYDDLFNHNNGDDLQSYPNSNFKPFDANVKESEEYGINENLLDNLTIARDSRYKFIYFPEDQYIRERIDNKLQIVLHHTVSGDKTGVAGDIKWWRDKDERIATAFIISRGGEIYQLFNTDFWAHHLGITSNFINEQGTTETNTYLNQHSIGIEIDSWGGLVRYNGAWYPTIMDNNRNNVQSFEPRRNAETVSDVQEYNSNNGYPMGFRGFYGFERYTDNQINAVRDLILSLTYNNVNGDSKIKGFPKISLEYNEDIWDINYDTNGNPIGSPDGAKGVSKRALNGTRGIWTHTSYRRDKSDCHPQPELIQMLRNLNSGTYNEDFNNNFQNNSK